MTYVQFKEILDVIWLSEMTTVDWPVYEQFVRTVLTSDRLVCEEKLDLCIDALRAFTRTGKPRVAHVD